MSLSYTSPYGFPFSLTVTQPPVDCEQTVSIDGVGYLIDTSANAPYNETWRRTSVDVLNSQQNPDEDGGSILPPEVWRRSQVTWHRGAGQTYGDRKDSDPYRFDASRGVNVWNRHSLTLLNDTEQALTGTGQMMGVSVSNAAVVAIGPNVKVGIDEPFSESEQWWNGNRPFDPMYPTLTPGWSNVTPALPSTPTDCASDGRYAWFIVGSTLYRVKPHAVSPTMTSVALPITPSMIEYCNGYMIAGVNGTDTTNAALYDISAITGSEPLAIGSWTPAGNKIGETNSSVSWKGACSGKSAIFLLAGRGAQSGIYSVSISRDTDSITLGPPLRMADLPYGETGLKIYSYLGYVMIGTSRGLRFATSDSTSLVYGPLIDIGRPVLCFDGQDRFVWFGWSDFEEGVSGLGRIDMSEFVSDLRPAYASDLMGSVGGAVQWVGNLSGRILFGVENSGIWRQTDTRVPSGWVRTSRWTFGVNDTKVAFYAQASTAPLSGAIQVSSSLDESEYAAGYVSGNGRSLHRFPLGAQTFTTMNATLTMMDTGLTDDTVKAVEVRATYVRGRASEWRVPVILRDVYELVGAEQARDVKADFAHLMGLVESGRIFTYTEGDSSWLVFATGFVWTPVEPSTVGNGLQEQFTLVFREVS